MGLRNFCGLIVLGGILCACAPIAGVAPAQPRVPQAVDRVVDPEELVALTGGPLTADRLTERATALGYRVERRDGLADFDLVLLTIRMPAGKTPGAAIRELERLEPGATIGRNHAYTATPSEGDREGSRVYADGLLRWPAEGCPAMFPIGVIDTALDPQAPDLDRARVMSRSFSEGGAGLSHGTAVAELLVGRGRLRDAQLFYAEAVGAVPGGDPAAGVDDIMRAVGWLHSSGVRLVNVSLAGPYNKILERGLRAAASQGMVIVAAAGNDGRGAPPRYPAAFDFTIAVTAVDARLDAYDQAQRGNYIDFAAPGVDVYVPVEGGRYLSGTSIAAPFVTALVAANPGAGGPVGSVRAILARDAVDIGAAGRDETFGAGLARAAAPCQRPSTS